MSLNVVKPLDEFASGRHQLYLVKCDCGKFRKVQKRRLKTNSKCKPCSKIGNTNGKGNKK